MTAAMYFLTPTYAPVGGVIKLLDYALHAYDLGWRVVMCCPQSPDAGKGVLGVPGLERIAPGGDVEYRIGFRFAPNEADVVLFSWPTHYGIAAERLPTTFPHSHILHILQNVRHGNPEFADGFAVRLLSRPLTRIALSEQILAAVQPYLHPTSTTELIPLGHRTDYFALQRSNGLRQPVRVAYTRWKSDLGDRVAQRFTGDNGFEFRGVGGVVGWPELRELYHWADVFLATPGPEEGHYLPGLEAMAAGAIVITPDVGGNRAYCQFGVNCIEVGFDNDEHVEATLRHLVDNRAPVERLRAAGYVESQKHTLTKEREAFAHLLAGLGDTDPTPSAATA